MKKMQLTCMVQMILNSVSEEDKKLITEIIRNAGSLQNLSNSLGTNPQNQNLRVLR